MTELNFYETLLNLPNLKLISLEKSPKKIIFYCEYTKSSSICGNCNNKTETINQREVRKFRDLKISEQANEKTEILTREAVINTYGSVLVTEKSIAILESNLKILEKNL